MAQTVSEIKKTITDRFIIDPVVIARYELTPGKNFEEEFSPVSIESLLFGFVAFCIWTHQMLMDIFKKEVEDKIANTKPGNIPWLVSKAKEFQFGYDLVPDGIEYDNTGISPALIEASKVVKYAAIVELYSRGIRVKVATESGGDLNPLTEDQLAAFKTYFHKIKPFCPIVFTNSPADYLKAHLKVYYNPLVLNSSGERLDGTAATPVQDAFKSFLKSQPFNGLFILTELLIALKAVEGVVIPSVVSAQARYADVPYQDIEVMYLPDSGYLRIYETSDLLIEFIPHASF